MFSGSLATAMRGGSERNGKPGASRGRNATGPTGSAELPNKENHHMRNTTKFLGGIAVAGLVAAGGSAFTATSTIDNANKTVGATGQTISGVAVSHVSYTWDSTSDATSGVDFTIDKALGSNDNLSVTLNSTPGDCAPVGTSAVDYTCTFATPVTNATALSIVVN